MKPTLPTLPRAATAPSKMAALKHPFVVQPMRTPAKYSTLPFDPACVAGLIDPHDCSFLEIRDTDGQLYELLLTHIAKVAPEANSFRVVRQRNACESDSDDDDDDDEC